MHSRIVRSACAALLFLGGVNGCGGLPQVARKESYALADNRGTRLGQLVQARLGAQRELTAAYPIDGGGDAFGGGSDWRAPT